MTAAMASSMHDHYLQHLDHEEDDFSLDEGNKKIRKPYTITKSRESWTDQEHDKFLEALHLFDRDWKKIEAFVGSKTVIQIRSHAQKYFLKVQKNRTGEHVPPPRPKRKSAQPYPQKAAKYGETDYVIGQQQYDVFRTNYSSMHATPWIHHARSSGTALYSRKDGPDFVEVYKFIGEVFDPEITGHFEKLMSMSSVDRETIMVLMRNLTINLGNPDHRASQLFSMRPRDDHLG